MNTALFFNISEVFHGTWLPGEFVSNTYPVYPEMESDKKENVCEDAEINCFALGFPFAGVF